jgi:hypothetical protein
MSGKLFSWSTIDSLKEKRFFRLLYYFTLYSMAVTFLLSGLRKFPGTRFTVLGLDNPVGLFFEGMYQTGIYWHFIGYFQIAAGVMAFIKRLPLGILFMLIVTVNIFLISVGLNMRGTPVITAAMLLGNIYLMLWNYRHYLPIIENPKG